ncbi:MAG: aldo/keto reductase [Oscillospiraceae bacterium]|nr:aldo/keto reductase [Oscillospiraceae bacterium]
MKYRDFGKTGVKISQLGFGCMRLPEYESDGKWYIKDEAIDMLRRAYELGVNYFDGAVGYCHENNEIALGKAVKPFRDKVLISTKCPLWGAADKDVFMRLLNQSLTRLDTSYIDFYHFHGLSKEIFDQKVLGFGLLDEARKAIDQGMIKHLSFSFHDDPNNMKYLIDRGEIFSSILMQYNLLDRSNESAMTYAHEKGLGTVIMGPVAGGRLAAPSQLYEKLLGKKNNSTSELAMRFVLGNPNVSCALSGMTNIQMVEENAAIGDLDEPMNEDDWNKSIVMMENLKKFSDLYCTGCEYCMPCPQGINIPYVFNCYTYHNVYGMPDLAKRMYGRVGDENHGKSPDECVKCGECMKKCPQKILIPDKLEEVTNIFK